jgi:hypothetical protein
LQAGNLPELNFTTAAQLNTALAQSFAFPEFPSAEVQVNMTQIDNARAEDIFSADVQAQFPSISEVMSAQINATNQPEPASDPVPAETPAAKKKPQARKKKAATKTQSSSDAKAKSVPMTMPVGVQQQLTEPSFGLDQVMASDPFVCSTASQQLPNNGQHMFNAGMPAMGQAPGAVDTAVSQTVQLPLLSQTTSGVADLAVQQMVQMTVPAQTSPGTASPVMQQQMAQLPALEQTTSKAASTMMQQSAPADFNIFMKTPSQTPPPASLPAMRSPPSTHIPAHPTATPSSDNKRKASAGHGMDTPTKRRQSVNQQGAVVPIAQPPPVPAIPQSFQDPAQGNQTASQSVQTPARNYQTPPQVPIDPALHYGISPPQRRWHGLRHVDQSGHLHGHRAHCEGGQDWHCLLAGPAGRSGQRFRFSTD